MFRSKAIKPIEEDKKLLGKLYSWWIDTKVARAYYHWTWKLIRNPLYQIKRLIQWYFNVFKNDYDFDAHCIFAILEYKLKRVEHALINGHAIQEPQDMKALKLAIKLAGRLKEDNYDMVEWERHTKKWGELQTWFTECEDRPGYSQWHSSRPKAITPQEQEQERQEHLAGMIRSEARMKREERWLYDILFKYLRKWWD